MHSALCIGTVDHHRYTPTEHRFRYPALMLYLDLAEADRVFSLTRLWSDRRFAPVRFHRTDYLGDPNRPLDECVRDEVESKLGRRPTGPIRMLTHPRYFGLAMNPITTYFCFEPESESLAAVVAEVTNTPWNEKYVYVWPASAVVDSLHSEGHRCPKDFHVSPFMPMNQTYHVRIVHRPNAIALRLDSEISDRPVFHAQLTLRKRPITAPALRRAFLRHPLVTAQVFARIYVQAFRLWRKKTPFFPHPRTTKKETVTHDHEHIRV